MLSALRTTGFMVAFSPSCEGSAKDLLAVITALCRRVVLSPRPSGAATAVPAGHCTIGIWLSTRWLDWNSAGINSAAVWNPSLMTVSIMLSFVTTTTSSRIEGTSVLPLLISARGEDRLALGHLDGDFRGLSGELRQRFVNGHRLSAVDDPLAGGELGILSRDEDLAGEAFLGERLDRAARGAVVRGQDRVEIRPGFGDRGVGDLLGVFRLPILGPVLVHDLESPRLMSGPRTLSCPCLKRTALLSVFAP